MRPNELITILDNRRQTSIRNYFLKYPLKARQKVQFITMDMSGAYIPLARKTLSKRQNRS
ncbi:MAG: transposase [Streptococcus salivarius]